MRKRSKSAWLPGLGLAVTAFLAAGCVIVDGDSASAQPREFHFTEPLKAGGRVELKTYKGEIRITGWDKAEIDVRAWVRPGDVFWGDAHLEEVRVEVERWGDTVQIRSRRRRDRGITIGIHLSESPYVDYEIRVPRELRLEIKDYKSSIHLADLDGRLRLDTYKGSLSLEDFRGAFELETYKGSARMEIKDLTGDSWVETYKGDVFLHVNPEDDIRFEAKLGRRAHFRTDFPVETNYRRYGRSRELISGTVGSGRGPRLSFESYKGTLTLTR